MTVQIITIDGPSGSGKGTLAAKLAAHYQFHLLDSGALYRLLGLSLHHHNLLDELDTKLAECVQIATNLDIQFVSAESGVQVWLNGEDVSQTIRTERVGEYASKLLQFLNLEPLWWPVSMLCSSSWSSGRWPRYGDQYLPRCTSQDLFDSFG